MRRGRTRKIQFFFPPEKKFFKDCPTPLIVPVVLSTVLTVVVPALVDLVVVVLGVPAVAAG